MSIFPFMDADINMRPSEELPLFREYAYDFINNCLKLKNGNTYWVEKNEALKIWIYKALITERYRYLAYSQSFGNEVHTLIGYTVHNEITFLELKRFIIESLMVNPYIEELTNFQFQKSGTRVQVDFDCNTIYGTMSLGMQWDEVESWTMAQKV